MIRREARDQRIVELRRRGLTYHQISDEVGLSRGRANLIVQELAPELVTRRRPIATADQVVELREKGASLHEIAAQLGTSVHYVYRRLRRLRPELAALTLQDLGLSAEDLAENERLRQLLELKRPVVARKMAQKYLVLRGLAEKGLSQEEAARATGVNSGLVSKYALRYGIEFVSGNGHY